MALMSISTSGVLHRDKLSWFCHIEAPTLRFVVWALRVFGGQWVWALQQSLMKQAAAGGRINSYKIHVGEVGTSGRMSIGRKKQGLAKKQGLGLGALLLSALALGGCSTSIADMPFIGTPADAPGRPKEAGSYLPVNQLPPDRDETAMDPAQRTKIQNELTAARDRQASATAASTPAK
jgi:hypothetical protein